MRKPDRPKSGVIFRCAIYTIVVYRRKRFSPARNEPGRGFRPKLCARWGRLCGAPIWTAGFKLVQLGLCARWGAIMRSPNMDGRF